VSRGLGRWQREILAAVEQYGAVYVRDLLADDASKSEITAVERAASQLHSAGRIALTCYLSGRPRLVAHRVDMRIVGRERRLEPAAPSK
jgi:hypothetical protein